MYVYQLKHFWDYYIALCFKVVPQFILTMIITVNSLLHIEYGLSAKLPVLGFQGLNHTRFFQVTLW